MDRSFWADLVSLAKAGYKPSDVKELLALSNSEPAEDQKDEKPEADDNKGDKPKETDENKSAFQRLAEK